MVDVSAFPKTFKYLEDQEMVIRIPGKEDENELLRFMRELPPNERIYFRDDVTDPEVIRHWVHETDLSKVIPLISLYEGQIVANWSLHLTKCRWTRHLAHIRGVVAPKYREHGIAAKMVYELLTLAGDLDIERLVIELVAQQKSLLAHFTDIGFKLEAVFKDWVKDHSGNYNDLLILTMKLEPAWKKMEELIWEYGTHGG